MLNPNVVTKPTEKPQPDAASYPVDALFVFDRHTRATFLSAFGVEAPPYDPSVPIKRWVDTSALIDPSTGQIYADPTQELKPYLLWDPVGRQIVKRLMVCATAASINLPGLVVYPKYTNPDTTPAVLISQYDGSKTPIDGANLCDPELLKTVAADIARDTGIAATAVVSQPQNGLYTLVYGAETRRYMVVCFYRDGQSAPAQTIDGASLLRERFGGGYGCPGKWVLNELRSPKFVADVQSDGSQDLRPEVLMPVRALKPTEAIRATGAAIGTLIWRTDREDQSAPASGGGLTAAQSATLSAIDSNVKVLVALAKV